MTDADMHFCLMVLVSFILFFEIILIVAGKRFFLYNKNKILFISFVVVIAGMLFGRYSANLGLPWWLSYPVPLLVMAILPPAWLKLTRPQTLLYLAISLGIAPLIHVLFSFVLGWKEYMPFWNIPFIGDIGK